MKNLKKNSLVLILLESAIENGHSRQPFRGLYIHRIHPPGGGGGGFPDYRLSFSES